SGRAEKRIGTGRIGFLRIEALAAVAVAVMVLAGPALHPGHHGNALRVGGSRHVARGEEGRSSGLAQRAVAGDRQDMELVALLEAAVRAGVLVDGVHEATAGVHGDLEDAGLARRAGRTAQEHFLELNGVQWIGQRIDADRVAPGVAGVEVLPVGADGSPARGTSLAAGSGGPDECELPRLIVGEDSHLIEAGESGIDDVAVRAGR